MAFAPIALITPQYEDYAGWWLKAYEQGTVTPLVMATDATGGTTLAKCYIDSTGFPRTSSSTNSPRFIPYINGSYDLWLFPTEEEADGDITVNAIQVADNVNADPASALISEWQSALAAIRTSTTTFTVVGDQTSDFHINRKLKFTGGADRYAAISNSVYTSLTTVTVIGATDSDGVPSTLHASMDTAYISILSADPTSANNNFYKLLPGETGVTNYEYAWGNLKRFGAKGDGVTDDTAAIETFLTNPPLDKLFVFPPGVYLYTNKGFTFPADSTVMAYGATLKKGPTITPYGAMVYPSDNSIIKGLNLLGYIDSGTNWSDVVPTSSFGFRFQGTVSNVLLEDVIVNNVPHDGIIVRESATNIRIINARIGTTSECYRNSLSIAPSSGDIVGNVYISGGEYAKAVDRPAIDIEPNAGSEIGHVWIGGGIKLTGRLDFLGGRITKRVVIDDVIMSSSDATFRAYLYDRLDILNMHFENGADIDFIGCLNQGTSGSPLSNIQYGETNIGSITGLTGAEYGENLLLGSSNSIYGYTLTSSGAGTGANYANVDVRGKRGIKIITDSGRVYTYRKYVPILPNTFYSVGGYMDCITDDGAILIRERDASDNILSYRTLSSRLGAHGNCVFLSDSAATHIDFVWGSHSSNSSFDGNNIFAGMYIRKGIVSGYVEHIEEIGGPLWNSTPTTGTWTRGERLSDPTPSASGTVGEICTASGTFSSASDVTGDPDGSTSTIPGLTDTSDFFVGEYVTVSAGMPSASTPYRILALTSTTMRLDTDSTSSQTNVTIVTVDPVFKTFGAIAA